jgi:methylated-DNA-[protein]-cysteine S-methyltransferase
MITPEYTRTVSTNIGTVGVTAVPEGICRVTFYEEKDVPVESAEGAPAFMQDCIRQLEEYFAGTRKHFDSLPLVLRSTDFQKDVWDAALDIPYGATWTYGDLAEHIGKPDAARAVGNALNRNPICIVVPCHRIVASTPDGGGYGGGVWRKEWLLALEKNR